MIASHTICKKKDLIKQHLKWCCCALAFKIAYYFLLHLPEKCLQSKWVLECCDITFASDSSFLTYHRLSVWMFRKMIVWDAVDNLDAEPFQNRYLPHSAQLSSAGPGWWGRSGPGRISLGKLSSSLLHQRSTSNTGECVSINNSSIFQI